MAKPILSLSDKRIEKIKFTHAAFCYNVVTKEFRFFNVDNIPEKWTHWRFLKVMEARRSGLTVSETIAEMNKELKNVRVKYKKSGKILPAKGLSAVSTVSR